MGNLAQITNPAFAKSPLSGMLGASPTVFLGKFISGLIGLTLVGGSVFFFFMIAVGAIQWTTSGGDKNAVEAARGRITNALTGIVILFATFAVVSFIEYFFNVKILTIDIGPLVI